MQQLIISPGKTRYLSQHTSPEHDFRFNFMKERRSEHFAEHNVRVIQLGGYLPLQFKKRNHLNDDDAKLVAFASHDETDIGFYQQLPLYHHLNIYQAYYESCTYGHIMEFFVPVTDAGELEHLIKKRPGIETGISKECLVPHL